MMKRLTTSMLACALMLIGAGPSLPAAGEAPKEEAYPIVKAAVNPNTATVGTLLEYRVTVAGKNIRGIDIRLPDKRVLFPEKEENGQAKDKKKKERDDAEKVPVYIIHNVRKEDRSGGGVTDISVVMDLSYYRPGRYHLPEIDLFDVDRVRIGYRVPEIEVKGLNEKGELEEIEPPLDLGGNYTRLLVLAGFLAVLGAAAYFALMYIMKKKEEAVPPPAVPPLDVFLGEMEGLRQKRLIEAGRVEEHVVEISALFRRFLSALLGVDTLEMTREETMRLLDRRLTGLAHEKNRVAIEDAMLLWDLAKFAEFAPSAETLQSNFDETARIARKISEGVRHARD